MVWGLCIALIAGMECHALACVLSQLPFLLLLLRQHRPIRECILYAVAVSLLFSHGYLDTGAYRRHARTFLDAAASCGRVTVRGWVSEYPRRAGGTSTFSFRTGCADGEFDIGVALRGFDAGYGDSLLLAASVPGTGTVTDTTASRRARYMRSRSRTGFVRVSAGAYRHLPGGNGRTLTRRLFWPLHERIRNIIVKALGSRAGLPLALMLGDKSLMSDDDGGSIRALGISHLFALSGLHLGLVLGIVLALLSPVRHGKTVLLCAVLGCYVQTVGDVVSLQRAYTMVAFGCMARQLQRPVRPVSILGRALLLLLMIDPGSFYSVGFQFSFLATFAVLLRVSRMRMERSDNRLRRMRTWLWESLSVSACAQLFILPLALRYFGESSLATPVTTLLFLPLVFGLLLATAVCCACATLSPDLGLVLFAWLGRGTDLFSATLDLIASRAPGPVTVQAPSLILYYTGVMLMVSPTAGRIRQITGFLLAAASFWSGARSLLP